jgi:hypothetical protein
MSLVHACFYTYNQHVRLKLFESLKIFYTSKREEYEHILQTGYSYTVKVNIPNFAESKN